MLIIVSGSRHATVAHLPVIARELAKATAGVDAVTLVHGAAPGADTIAARLAEQYGWPVVAYPALWQRCDTGIPEELGGCPSHPHLRTSRHGVYCPNAGPRRNQHMADAYPNADLLLAFPDCRRERALKGGTWDMVGRAATAGIPTRIRSLAIATPTQTAPIGE